MLQPMLQFLPWPQEGATGAVSQQGGVIGTCSNAGGAWLIKVMTLKSSWCLSRWMLMMLTLLAMQTSRFVSAPLLTARTGDPRSPPPDSAPTPVWWGLNGFRQIC